MKICLLAIVAFLAVPAIRAQQNPSNHQDIPAANYEPAGNFSSQSSLDPALKPGHPLDPADVEVLTGKRDREIEASRRNTSVFLDGYGLVGYGRNQLGFSRQGIGQLGFDLPLRRIGNPFFFDSAAPSRFVSRGFGGRSGRGGRRAH